MTAQNLSWVKQLGGPNSDEGRSVAVDKQGNVLTTGVFEGTADFDPGDGISELTSTAGSNDVFINKLDANGNLLWTNQIGGAGNEYAFSITTDVSGNIYVIGLFSGTVDFDSGPGTFDMNSVSQTEDIFIAKLDASGNLIWAKQMGGISDDYGYSIAVDAAGNVYSTGYFQFTADFDPGPNEYNLTAESGGIGGDIFVSKLDPSGNFLWAKRIGGADTELAYSVATDDLHNVYITGLFESATDFDPGDNTFSLTPQGYDIFICKLTSDGDFAWAKQFGGPANDIGRSIAVDGSGNVHVTGDFGGTLEFEPGVAPHTFNSFGSTDILVVKLNSSGAVIWVKQLGGIDDDHATAISLDETGNVYTTGGFHGTGDFDPGPETNSLSSGNSGDIFISKLGTDGDFKWAKQLGSSIWGGMGYSIAVDRNGVAVTTGYFEGTVDFDPGPNVKDLSSDGYYTDIFVHKVTPCYTKIDAVVACDSYKWIDGKTYTTSNNTATSILTDETGCDSFVTLNLTINKSTSSIDVVTACDSYKWIDGNTYTTSNNTATYKLTNKVGCDSLVALNLIINKSTSSIDVVAACDSYKWIDGNTYTTSNNIATHTLTNKVGCDSLIALNLTIHKSTSSIDVVAACDSFKWINGNTYTTSNNTATYKLTNKVGCDSLVALNLTISKSTSSIDVVAACNSYKWIDGKTYTTSTKTPTYMLTSKAGCDSLLTLNLTINKVDTTVVSTPPTNKANAKDATYKWFNCDTNNYIPEANSRSFNPSVKGVYAVEVIQNGCVGRSKCVQFIITGIEEEAAESIYVYPNPTKGSFDLNLSSRFADSEIKIFNSLGAVVTELKASNDKLNFFIEEPSGLFILSITSPGGEKVSIKVIKE